MRYKRREDVCRVDADILDKRNRLQQQKLKDLRVLDNFKEIDGKDEEDPKNFPGALVLLLIRTGK